MKFKQLCTGFLVGAALALTAPVHAQPFPNKPIRILIGFAAGGPTDVIGRVLAQDMTATLGQSVLVENRTGANSLIATEAVAKSAPDGYTLLFASLSHNVNPLLMKKVSYDPLADFVPISMTATLPMVVVVGAGSPANSVKDIVATAKADPGKVSFGSAGNGGSAHLAGALLQVQSGAQFTHVPFRGNAPALTDVIAGNVSFMFYPIIGIAEFMNQKRVKVLAVGTPSRHADFPGVPTMLEMGYKGFDETAPWVGMLAPAGTPPAVTQKLYEAMNSALAKPEVKERLRGLGAVVVGSSPTEFRAFLPKDKERWTQVIKAANIQPE